MAETDGKGNFKAEYTRADSLFAQVRDGNISYYLYDGHGDVRALVSEAGEITDQYRYNAYGELIETTGNTENHYLYTGEYYDGTSSLYYLRARYMNPSTGSFMTMDTYEGSIYDPDTLHKYLYANGNPVTYSDPSGNFFGAIGGLVATTINTVINNYQILNIMGIISGITNSAITAFLGGNDAEIGDAFFKGYVTGFGIGAVMYVVAAYEIITIAQMCMIMAASNTVMNVVLAFVSASSGNTKATLVYGTLSILSLVTFCELYNVSCTVDIVGDKGSVRVDFDNSDIYSPKYNGKKINAGTPNEKGVDGENYVAQQLKESHNTTKVEVNDRNRIPDFYNEKEGLVVEVKNVEKQSYTLQLKDNVKIAQDNKTTLILYVRKNTVLTKSL